MQLKISDNLASALKSLLSHVRTTNHGCCLLIDGGRAGKGLSSRSGERFEPVLDLAHERASRLAEVQDPLDRALMEQQRSLAERLARLADAADRDPYLCPGFCPAFDRDLVDLAFCVRAGLGPAGLPPAGACSGRAGFSLGSKPLEARMAGSILGETDSTVRALTTVTQTVFKIGNES